MRLNSPDVLAPELWLAQMKRLRQDCESEDRKYTEFALRRAFHLAELAPPPLSDFVTPGFQEDALEELIGRGSLQSAAQAIAGDQFKVTVSRLTGQSGHLAKVRDANGMTAAGRGASPALAILAAWACFLANPPQTAVHPQRANKFDLLTALAAALPRC
jgi:hypothetical protein